MMLIKTAKNCYKQHWKRVELDIGLHIIHSGLTVTFKCHKISFQSRQMCGVRALSEPARGPRWGTLQRSPRPPRWFKGAYF